MHDAAVPVGALREVIDEVRTLFHRLKLAAERIHGEGGHSAPRRGVLLSLRRGGPLTVPQIAAERPVSRQHIQVVVNGLLEDGLVELRPNPDHIRSHLVALTAEGEERITGMLAKETEVLGALDLAADERALWETASVLASIRRALEPITNSPT